MIEKLVTARGPEYVIGHLICVGVDDDYRKIASIEAQFGDYEVGSAFAYTVNLSDGRTITVKDAVEVWHKPEPETDGSDPRDGEPTVIGDDGIEIAY